MAIVLNDAAVLRGKGIAKSHDRAVLVPPAAVWDPVHRQALHAESAHGSPRRLSDVRTLSVEGRTQGRTVDSARSSVSSQRRGPRGRRSGSNVGNYVLGAVFGAAVFIGTVWGGLSIDSEVPSVSGTAATAAASSR